MGKSRKGRAQPHKVNPTGLPSMKDAEMLDDDEESGPVASICSTLQNATNVEEILDALQALSYLCQNPTHVEVIINNEVVRLAAPLLVHTSPGVRYAVSGVLRNLSAVSVGVAESLVKQDIFTPLSILLTEYAGQINTGWTPVNNQKVKQKDSKSETFLHVMHLVWNLCESSSEALEFFNQLQLIEIFVKCLNHELFGLEIALAVSQCLLVVSEDNAAAWKLLINHNATLKSVLPVEGDFKALLLRTTVCGVISNVPSLLAQNLQEIIAVLSKTIEVDHRKVLNEISSTLSIGEIDQPYDVEVRDDEMEEDADNENSTPQNGSPTETKDKEVELVGCLLTAQRIASEILSNVCTPEDEENQSNAEDESDSEVVYDYDMSQQSINGTDVASGSGNYMSAEISEALEAARVVENLWKRTKLLPENVKQILEDSGTNLYKRLKSMRVSCLLCLHNFCNSMTTEQLGGPAAIYAVWLSLGQEVFQCEQEDTSTEALTSLMRASLEHLKESSDLFTQMTESDLLRMLEGINNCNSSEIKANWLRMLGILGCLLPEMLVKKIMAFMLEISSKETDIWVLSESIDSFMDIFSKNDWPQLVAELDIHRKSKELEKMLKMKIRQQRKELGDRYVAVNTIKTNLSRFCKYLEGQKS